jgi:hypothetical protein
MARIESLTPEQEARMAEYAARWTEISLATSPADRPRAEAAIREMYRQGGLEPPAKIVWCGSPLSMLLTSAVIIHMNFLEQGWNSVRDSVADIVTHIVDARIWDIVGGSVSDSIDASVGTSVGADVWDIVCKSVWASVHRAGEGVVSAGVRNSVAAGVEDSVIDSVWTRGWDIVTDSLRASVRDDVRIGAWDTLGDSVWDSIIASVYSGHESGWLAFYGYFHDVLGLTAETARLSGLWELARSAGWALPHKDICWVSERHNILERDERGRLHSVAGPACAYPDGWAIYAVHGVPVPEYVVERPAEITVERIDGEANV